MPVNVGFGVKVYCPVLGFKVIVPVVVDGWVMVVLYVPFDTIPLSLVNKVPVTVTLGVVAITSGLACSVG